MKHNTRINIIMTIVAIALVIIAVLTQHDVRGNTTTNNCSTITIDTVAIDSINYTDTLINGVFFNKVKIIKYYLYDEGERTLIILDGYSHLTKDDQYNEC